MQTARIRHSSFSSWYAYHEMGVSHGLCYRESHIGAFWSCFGCLYNFMKTIKWAAFGLLRSQINRPPLTNSGRQRNDMLWEHSKQLERGWGGGLGLWHRRLYWIPLPLAWILFDCMKCFIKKNSSCFRRSPWLLLPTKKVKEFLIRCLFLIIIFLKKAPHEKMHK